jgi:hypothetical protein
MHALAFRKRQKGELPAALRRAKAVANGLDSRGTALDVPIVNRPMFGRRIGLADIHGEQGEAHRKRLIAPRRLVERPQQMFAEIHRIVGDLRNAEQGRDLGRHGRQGAAGAQSHDHPRRKAGHQTANKLGPDIGRRNAIQRAGRDLSRHLVPRILIEFAIAFAKQGRKAQD